MAEQNGKGTPLLMHQRFSTMSYKERQLFPSESGSYYPYGHRTVRVFKAKVFHFLEHPKGQISSLYHSFV